MQPAARGWVGDCGTQPEPSGAAYHLRITAGPLAGQTTAAGPNSWLAGVERHGVRCPLTEADHLVGPRIARALRDPLQSVWLSFTGMRV
ncbi:hypothetical protein GCM10009642_53190 [Nocardiopsis metallicus]